jgi:transcriptional regulator with XRE-family HTH domain
MVKIFYPADRRRHRIDLNGNPAAAVTVVPAARALKHIEKMDHRRARRRRKAMAHPRITYQVAEWIMPCQNPKEVGPHWADEHVGWAVRHRRIVLGLSLAAVAKELGLTFQQLQKYEHGTNRISASKLYKIAQILMCKPGDFFPPADAPPLDHPAMLGAGHLRMAMEIAIAVSELRHDQLEAILGIAKAMSPADHATERQP